MIESLSEFNNTESQSNFVSDDLKNQIDSGSQRQQKPPADLDESMHPNEVHYKVECDGSGVAPIVIDIPDPQALLKNFFGAFANQVP